LGKLTWRRPGFRGSSYDDETSICALLILIVLNDETRRKLVQQSRGVAPARLVMRSEIVLLARDGLLNKQIAKALQVAPRMVTLVARETLH
jgi:DNA-binding NarL/FixJ family response regulator